MRILWPSVWALAVIFVRILFEFLVWRKDYGRFFMTLKRIGVDFAFIGFSIMGIVLTKRNPPSRFYQVFGMEPEPVMLLVVITIVACGVVFALHKQEERWGQRRIITDRVGLTNRLKALVAMQAIGVALYLAATLLL